MCSPLNGHEEQMPWDRNLHSLFKRRRKPVLVQVYEPGTESQRTKPSWCQGPDLAGHSKARQGP